MNTRWLTRTAVILALAISIQLFRLPQPVTGPAINALLLLAAMLVGPGSAVLIGCITPVIAILVGITPPVMLPMVPVIMLANATLVLVFYWTAEKPGEVPYTYTISLRSTAAVAAAALSKFVLFYIATTYVLNWLQIKLPAAAVAVFGIPQLYTALAGGALALILVRYLSHLISRTDQV